MKPAAGSKIAVLGLRDSGTQSALCLHKNGYRVFASDLASDEIIQKRAMDLVSHGIDAEYGKHSFDKILACQSVLISPGIPPSSKIYQAVLEAKLPMFSEIEAASWFSPAKTVIAITGSCGKTTTATLMAEMLEASGRKVVLCGNIGNPWIGELSNISSDTIVVLEVSSFQLMHCESFSPSIGLLLNIFPNHMDWHADMQEYANAKLNLFRTMDKSQVMICRKQDEKTFFSDFKTEVRRVYFDDCAASNPNEAALLCAAEALNCDRSLVSRALSNFKGIAHRLEKFAEHEGVIFINDSKATTTASLAWALEKFADGTVVLICGGKYKTDIQDFKNLSGLITKKTREVILIGAARPLMKEAWKGSAAITEAETLDEACRISMEKARMGDTVLLSPACASFDMFHNYQERGNLFKQKILDQISKKQAVKVS